MHYIHIICIGLIFLLLGASVKAEERRSDGNKLLSTCESKIDTGELTWCYGYIKGILDMQSLEEIPNLPPCVSPRQ